ncbi:MAG: hypothetical protein AAGF99_02010 [Bacteroidota bacterium]
MGLPTPTPIVAAASSLRSAPTHADSTQRLQTLADDARDHGSPSAFQAVLAASRCALRDVRQRTALAKAAALSLAQHERLDAMAGELRVLDDALEGVLEASGRCLVDADTAPARARRPRLRLWQRSASPTTAAASAPRSWGDTAEDLLVALDAQIDRLDTLASGQPHGAPSQLLATDVTRVLARHRDALRTETQRCAA